MEAVSSLKELVAANGPFDGVIGFSQGAVLAAMLLIKAQGDPACVAGGLPFRCAIFLCGGLPFDYRSLLQGTVRQMEPGGDKPALIHLPVVNCWAADDADFPGMGPPLAKLGIARSVGTLRTVAAMVFLRKARTLKSCV